MVINFFAAFFSPCLIREGWEKINEELLNSGDILMRPYILAQRKKNWKNWIANYTRIFPFSFLSFLLLCRMFKEGKNFEKSFQSDFDVFFYLFKGNVFACVKDSNTKRAKLGTTPHQGRRYMWSNFLLWSWDVLVLLTVKYLIQLFLCTGSRRWKVTFLVRIWNGSDNCLEWGYVWNKLGGWYCTENISSVIFVIHRRQNWEKFQVFIRNYSNVREIYDNYYCAQGTLSKFKNYLAKTLKISLAEKSQMVQNRIY